jgi:hypothetical protein
MVMLRRVAELLILLVSASISYAQGDSNAVIEPVPVADTLVSIQSQRSFAAPSLKAGSQRHDSSTTKVNSTSSVSGTAYTALPRGVTPPMTFAPYDVNSIGLSLIQSASGNWVQGEQNHFVALINAKSIGDFESGKWNIKRSFTFDLGARYAQDSSEFHPVRVSDNQVFLEAVVSYNAGWSINPYASSSIRTAVTESFTYYGLQRRRTAGFWDPVISQHSIGFSYVSYKGFDYYSVRTGLGFYSTRARRD